MLFDSWGGQLPPAQWDAISRPAIERMVSQVKAQHPEVPIVLYANGSGGLLERMGCGATRGAAACCCRRRRAGVAPLLLSPPPHPAGLLCAAAADVAALEALPIGPRCPWAGWRAGGCARR